MNLARQLLQRAMRGRSYWRRLPAAFGHAPVRVSPESALKYLKIGDAAFPQDLLTVAQTYVRKDDVIWDVGANVGVFSAAASYCAGPRGRVVAFEPDSFLVGLLEATSQRALPSQSPIDVVPVALAGHAGLGELEIAAGGRSMNALRGHGRSAAGKIRQTRYVPLSTLDSMLEHFPAPSVLKIDVEGAEMDVLNGGLRLLELHHPVIYAEIGEKFTQPATALLRSFGYDLATYIDGAFSAAASCTFNTLATYRKA